MIKYLLMLGFLSSLSFKNMYAQPPAIKKYFDKVDSIGDFHGNILLSSGGRIILQRSYGLADIRRKKPNAAGTHFNLASVSKIFTATAILQLKEKNLLELDKPVSLYLPGFPYRNISIRHLLTHTSGLPDLELFENIVKEFPDTIVHNVDIIPELKKWNKGLYFEPGEKFSYNNNGYSILAMVVEKITRQPFNKYLQQNIFTPAGMFSTYIHGMGNRTVKDDTSYVVFHTRLHPLYDSAYTSIDSVPGYKYTHVNISGTVGAGNIITTTADMQLFDAAFFSGKLLRASSMKEAFIPARLNNGKQILRPMDTMQGEGQMYQGLGWELFDQPLTGFSVGHGGYKFGLATFYCHHIFSNTAVVAYSNAPGGDYGGMVTSAMLLMQQYPALLLSGKKSLVAAYGTALVSAGADEAASILMFHRKDSTRYYLSEWEMNELGYNLFYQSAFAGHRELAVECFKVATMLFPESFNPYDSYGQLLAETGKKAAAIRMYQMSLLLNAQNDDGRKALERLRQ